MRKGQKYVEIFYVEKQKSTRGKRKMKLNLGERFTVLGLLPKENNFVTLGVVRELQKVLAPTEAEFKEFELTQEGDKFHWNQKGIEERSIKIGEKAKDIIIEALEELDKQKKLTFQTVSLYEKFVKGGKNNEKND